MSVVISESLIPFIFYILAQILVFFAGMCLVSKNKTQEWCEKTALETYISGQMLIWAVFQILAVPMVFSKARFDVLFYGFVIIVAVLCVVGCIRFFRLKQKRVLSFRKKTSHLSGLAITLLVIAIVLILFQVLTYYFGQHVDADDARWLAEANDALAYGDMMTRNVSTGAYLGYFETVRDVTSPWPMYIAVLARIFHVRTAVAAHTLYAPVAMLMVYEVYYLISVELFKKAESRFAFLLAVAVINLFYAGTVYTQSVFTLVRIWQGKATVAGVIIPLFIYLFICINKRDKTIDWLRLAVTCCAACLLSGMGISMAGIMVFVYGIYSIVSYWRWKRIPVWLLSLVPVVVFLALYLQLKGI